MSKGTILSGGTGGQYSVAVALDDAAIAARIAVLESRLASIQADITTADGDLEDLEDVYSALLDEQNALIDAFAADPIKDNLVAINEKTAEAAEAAAAVGTQRAMLAALVADEASTRKEITRLSAAPATVTTSAWCADLTEDLAGDVGLIEVPGGERGQHLQIRPGHEGAAAYSVARDGGLRQPFADVPAATTYNLAMLPGWQTWLPRYRLAQINSIDAEENTCSLTIASAISSQQGLGVNYATAYSAVPIEYMTCDHEAFGDGDIVVVEFVGQTTDGIEGNWAAGKLKVIGFSSNPKPCEGEIGFAYNDGLTFVQLNGTVQAKTPALLAGNRDWINSDGRIHISWMGSAGIRYMGYWAPDVGNPQTPDSWLYCNGDYIRDEEGDPIEAPDVIAGAAFNESQGLLYVVTCLYYSDPLADRNGPLDVYKIQARISNRTIIADGAFEAVSGGHWAETDQVCYGPAFFNASATTFAFTTQATDDLIQNRLRYCRDLWQASVAPASVSYSTTYAHSQSKYYYCCDYKQDALVYATVEPDPPGCVDGFGVVKTKFYGASIPDMVTYEWGSAASTQYTPNVYLAAMDLRVDFACMLHEIWNLDSVNDPSWFRRYHLYLYSQYEDFNLQIFEEQ